MKILNVSVKLCRTSNRYKHWNSFDQQYLQRSRIPTMHFQQSLPRLPIPKLEQTCNRYLAAQQPILANESFKKTIDNVEEFKNSIGKTLQEVLLEKDKKNKHTSYISEPWFDMYLKDRKPLPINYNPTLIFVNDERSEYNDQLLKATNILISSLRFYKSLQMNILEPEVFHLNPKKSDTQQFRLLCSWLPSAVSWYGAYLYNAYPLDMSQYNNLFHTTRIPCIDKDIIYSKPKSKHIVVQHNGHFYSFDVLDENNYIISPEKLLGNFKSIINRKTLPNEFPLGILTTLNRNEWSNLRQHLLQLGNTDYLELIDSAILNICLDDLIIGADISTLCRSFLHGDGKNRWFDKSFSLIISKDGIAGINFEHSWGDGVAVLRYFQDVHKDSLNNSKVHPDTKPDIQENTVKMLDFKLDDKIKSAVIQAIATYKATCDSLDFNTLEFDGLGKNVCKNYGVSPDAIMQLGFQDANYKLNGDFAASYESCSTAAFKHGRTETIRPCTMATKTYCLAANSKQQPSLSELRQLVLECSKAHGQLLKDAVMGQGFDRHLFALKLLAANINKKCNIFEDPAYEALNHNIVSTSTLSSPAVWAGGFGPVVKNGFGIGYSIRDDALGVLVTSYLSQQNGKDFVDALNDTYKKLLFILKN